jgi:hypothetical protein
MSQILIHFRIDLKGKLHREKKDLEKHFFFFVAPDLPLGYLAICGGENSNSTTVKTLFAETSEKGLLNLTSKGNI